MALKNLIPIPPRLDKPHGDPEAMTALAVKCRAAAKQLRAGAHTSKSAVDTMLSTEQFQARAAKQLAGVVRGNSGSADRANEELVRFAQDLDTGAAQLTQAIKQYEERERAISRAHSHNESVRSSDAAKKEFGVDGAGRRR